jgi:hypothetical protein
MFNNLLGKEQFRVGIFPFWNPESLEIFGCNEQKSEFIKNKAHFD